MSGKIDSSTTELNRHSIMSSVSTFKSSVVRVRDILRGPGMSITGMDSMRHICLYLLSRYITVERASLFGVPEAFAWETLLDQARTQDGGLQRALDRFFHTETDCLVAHFDRLFGTEKFQFDVKGKMGLQKHFEILEILDKVNMSDVDCEIDMLGWVYEQHLKSGSSSAGRDLGQFFTDRFICEYMTELCEPTFKHPGVPESVCDPSMGTGGFLTYYIKYFNKKYPDQVQWKVQEKVVHGNDTDPRVAGVARMNLFMETGGCCPTNLQTHDSLYGDLKQTGYDVILANMPFGLKGIKHADCCERVKDLKIRGTKSEPLFLQLMMVSLNPGGRCAVVVPDGMLVNSSTCHDDTRKYLMDHFELKRVIKLKGKFFMNTGIQPSVLFFENTGKPTTAVEFWEVIKGDGKVHEEMILSVPRERFTDACCLDVRKYQEVNVAANPAGFPMVKLGDLFDIPSIKHRYTNKDSSDTGLPFYNGCYNSPLTFINTVEPSYNSATDYLIMIKDGGGDHNSSTVGLGKTFMVNGSVCIASQNIILIPKTTHSLKFIYYTLCINIKFIRDLSTPSINLEHISVKNILDYGISIPPLAVQQEIVATLDRIYQPGTTELSETLKLTSRAMDLVLAQPNGTMLEPIVEAQRMMRKSAQMAADVKAQMAADVKAQMAAIVKSVGCRGFPVMKLGDIISKIGSGKTNSTSISNTGEYPFYGCTAVVPSGSHSSYDFDDTDYLLFAKSGGNAKHPNSYSMGIGKFHHIQGRSCGNVAIYQYKIRDEHISTITYPYLTYILNVNLFHFQSLAKYTTGNGNIDVNDAMNFTFSLPPLDFQQAVLVRLDALQSQLVSLETLSKQAEDNARFILESYLGTA